MRKQQVKQILLFSFCAIALVLGFAAPSFAGREASFVDPRSTNAKMGSDTGAITVEPKDDIDLGESATNVMRRVTLFFVNRSADTVDLTNVSVTGDGDLKTSISDDECSKAGKIEVGGRCLVTVEIVPGASGTWSAEVLLVHKGAGQVAHAHVHGKVSGGATQDKRETGLLLSTKDAKPVDFGSVDTDGIRVTRSILMVNDSAEAITLLSIDLIAAENGLERSKDGCTTDLVLNPGESCPITLVWNPATKGMIATDVIIRHTGKLGFAVIPVRGIAKDDGKKDSSSSKSSKSGGRGADAIPMPSSSDLEAIVSGKIPSVSSKALGARDLDSVVGGRPQNPWRLIGTVGRRAILQKPDGAVAVISTGDEINFGDNKTARLDSVSSNSAMLIIGKTRKNLLLQRSPELVSKAVSSREDSSGKAKEGRSKASSGHNPYVAQDKKQKQNVSLEEMLQGAGAH